jgi:hypothetical protein
MRGDADGSGAGNDRTKMSDHSGASQELVYNRRLFP